MAALPKTCIKSILASSKLLDEIQEDCHRTCDRVDYITSPISYEVFFSNYLLLNRPCILGSWATEGWKSRQEWVNPSGIPNCDFLKEKFGNATAPIADCDQEVFSSHLKHDAKFGEYMDYLEKTIKHDDLTGSPCHYLKDWHFVRDFPDYKAYITPPFFRSDWLNEYWDHRPADACSDDYRFVYMGPKGSWTPFHADVFRSYSWSANICGRKKWLFFPPGEEEKLKDRYGNLAFDLRSDALDDKVQFPNADSISRRFEVIQEEGEVIFVPSRWHHQVFNLEATISINHNWMNGCNVHICWRHLVAALSDVQKEIADCWDMDGWGQQCQLILKASSGMDYKEFFQFIVLIAERRIQYLQQQVNKDSQGITGLHKCQGKQVGKADIVDASKWESGYEKGGSGDENHEAIAHKCESMDTKCEPMDKKLESMAKEGEAATMCSNSDKRINELCDITDCGDSMEKLDMEVNSFHVLFDLQRVESILAEMLDNKEFPELDNLDRDPVKFLSELKVHIEQFMDSLDIL